MEISRIDAVNFAAKPSKNVEQITSKVFKKLSAVRGNKLGTYLGTTQNGDNVTIRETSLGKAADFYVSYSDKMNKGAKKFDIFHITKSTDAPAKIVSDEGKKASKSDVAQIGRMIDTLV